VRLAPPECREGWEGSARGTGGQAISQLQRQSLSSWEYIDTSGTHWPVYNIAYRYARAPTFRRLAPHRRETSLHLMIPIDRVGPLNRPEKYTLGNRFSQSTSKKLVICDIVDSRGRGNCRALCDKKRYSAGVYLLLLVAGIIRTNNTALVGF